MLEYKCLLASPGDVETERTAVSRLVQEWNAHVGKALGCRVELVRWETHVAPQLADSAQGIINREAVDVCDFAIALFWSRLGTPTATHSSGSIEEIERMRQRGAHVLVYFCSRPIPQTVLREEPEQFRRLQDARAKLEQSGVVGRYSEPADLEGQLQLHLTTVVTRLLLQDRGDSQLGHSPATLLKPEIRVKVSYAFVPLPGEGIQSVLGISVENHSPMVVFMGNVFVNTRGVERLVLIRDAITGAHQRRRQLLPGEAFSVHFDPTEFAPRFPAQDLISAGVVDDIGRKWSSDEDEFRKAVEMFMEQQRKHR